MLVAGVEAISAMAARLLQRAVRLLQSAVAVGLQKTTMCRFNF